MSANQTSDANQASSTTEASDDQEQARRWRLLLGDTSEQSVRLSGQDLAMDAALAALYDNQSGGDHDFDPTLPSQADSKKSVAGLGASAPRVAAWLGDIRRFFPKTVVQVMQSDAIERLGLKRLLLEPELMEAVVPDVHLVATLVELQSLMPGKAKATAREVVRKVVEDVERRIADSLRSAVRGALNRAQRTSRPLHSDIDWMRTIRTNLRTYQAEYGTVIPERLVGYGRKQSGFSREIVLCVDQSGSMAASVVYASIFACVLASIRALRTHLVVYDTAVADLTAELNDPVEVIFGTQLGGGTDTCKALAYCEPLITRPADTVFVLISDLYDADSKNMIARLGALHSAGVCVIVLLALNDEGVPSYDHNNAAALTELGIACFACTPDAFGDLMAAAIQRDDIGAWASTFRDTQAQAQ